MHRDHQKMLKGLGANLRSARNKIGITLPTLCKLSGVSKGNVSKIEHGIGNLTAVTLYRLCWSLGIHPRDVLPDCRKRKSGAAIRSKGGFCGLTQRGVKLKREMTQMVANGFLPPSAQSLIRSCNTQSKLRGAERIFRKVRNCWSPNRSIHITKLQALAISALRQNRD